MPKMHKAEDFTVDPRALTPELLEEREWKKRALLDVLEKDIFNAIGFVRIMLDWDLSSWKIVSSSPKFGIEHESAIMFKHGRSNPNKIRRSVRLCCKSFTKMNANTICFGSNFHMNCLEVLEDLVEFTLENEIIYDVGPLATREVKLWEKWSSLEEIYLKARL